MNDQEIQKEDVLTTGQVADYCLVSSTTVYRWIKQGKLKAYTTPGRQHRILKRDLEEFLEKYNMVSVNV